MANVFISHRKIDGAAAERLGNELQHGGHSVWLDAWQINVGDSIVARIEQGLSGSSYLLLCFSSSGLSAWMDREWMSALARQLTGYAVKVIPVRLTGGTPPAILADIRFADLVDDWNAGVRELLNGLR